jgi:hypothetical protein
MLDELLGRNDINAAAADNQLLDFNVAKAACDKAKADLEAQQQQKTWLQSRSCAKRTLRADWDLFCQEIDAFNAKIARYEPVVVKGRPVASNAQLQYDLLSRITESGLEEDCQLP